MKILTGNSNKDLWKYLKISKIKLLILVLEMMVRFMLINENIRGNSIFIIQSVFLQKDNLMNFYAWMLWEDHQQKILLQLYLILDMLDRIEKLFRTSSMCKISFKFNYKRRADRNSWFTLRTNTRFFWHSSRQSFCNTNFLKTY